VHFARIAVIYNPRSGRPRERVASINRLASMLREEGRAVDIFSTQRANHATELAGQAVASGCDLVIAHGGDGTMNEVLQAVCGTSATLGFWPGGTANLLASEINFPHRVGEVVQRVLQGQVKRVTVGKANDRYFLLMAGVGIDAAVVRSVDAELKRFVGKAAFMVSALKVVWNWKLDPFRVHMPGEEVLGRFVVAGNAQSYGGGFRLTPMAKLTDPQLDLCIFTSDRRRDYVAIAVASLITGSHKDLPGVIYRKVTKARITSAARTEAPVQLDGEVVGTLPLTLEAIPEGVQLLV